MEYDKAVMILKNINKIGVSDLDKIDALLELSLEDKTNGVTKKDFQKGLHWLLRYHNFYEIKVCDMYDVLLKRFKHLMCSEYIRSFDAVNPTTGEYMRDIKEAKPQLSCDLVDMVPVVLEELCKVLNDDKLIQNIQNSIIVKNGGDE